MKRHLKEALLGVVVLVGLAGLTLYVHSGRLQSAADHYRAELKKAGGVTDLGQMLPPIPDPDKDGTEVIRRAAAWLHANSDDFLETNYHGGMQMTARGKALIIWQQPDLHSDDSTNSWADLEAFVARSQPLFGLLEQLPDHPEFNFHFHYERGEAVFTNLFSELFEIRDSSRYLAQAVEVDLHRGQLSTAFNHEQAMLTLVQAAESQRLLISYLVGAAVLHVSEATLWDILQSPDLNDRQLAELQKQWETADMLQAYENALNMERLCDSISLVDCRRSNAELKTLINFYSTSAAGPAPPYSATSLVASTKLNARSYLWRYWYSYPDELHFLQGATILQKTINSARKTDNYLLAWSNQVSELNKMRLTNSDFPALLGSAGEMNLREFFSESITDEGQQFHRTMANETSRRIAITAIGLKRYQLKHGEYPDQLSELVPDLVATVPIDPMSGKPLCYRRQTKGTFLLYSVGENGVDDGGDPNWPSDKGGHSLVWLSTQALDWVWPQVASPAEVQAFREHPPK